MSRQGRPAERALLDEAWTAVTDGDRGETRAPRAPLELTGPGGGLPSRYPVEATAVACIGAALLAAAALSRDGEASLPTAILDRRHVAMAVRSEAHFQHGGKPAGAGFAPLSRFWPCADGWVRTHANYPWHRRALTRALGTPDEPDAVAGAIDGLAALDVERRVFAAGGIAAAVRTLDAWQAHPQGRSVAAEPLVGRRLLGPAPARTRTRVGLPASGVRVLDLTRVIAGPVCTRFLGALGADVLRVDPPGYPDLPAGAVADTLLGKRSAILDLASPAGDATLGRLLAAADVVVIGYRPGSLDRFGLDPRQLAERHPGTVVVRLAAWGHSGPWASRRGFDSIVQAASGIARGEAATPLLAARAAHVSQPAALPCQLLDHGTGYLAAAATLDALRHQEAEGGSHMRSLSLARTAAWLTSAPPAVGPDDSGGTDTGSPEFLTERVTDDGTVRAVAPPGALGGRRLSWPATTSRYGVDRAAW